MSVTERSYEPAFAGSRIAKYLSDRIEEIQSVKNQREIAQEAGYDKPNIISMFKRGETKIPLDRIPALAKALNVSPAFMFRLAMEQYWPDLHKTVNQIFGNVVSANEVEILQVIREASKDTDPALTSALKKVLTKAIKTTIA